MQGATGKPGLDGPLDGGSMNAVVREGDTVVRNAGPWTPTVHRYLRYLQVAGIDWVPRPLESSLGAGGEPDRERLSYIHGDVPVYPLPDWVWADQVLVDGAQHLRRLHDASIGFGRDGAVWQAPAKIPVEVVCHNDFSPHNLAFRDGRIVGAIDFDFCSPGPRLWDIAYFAIRIAPLTATPPQNAPGMARLASTSADDLGCVRRRSHHDLGRRRARRDHPAARPCRSVSPKAEELKKRQLLDDANAYDRDGHYLATLRG